MNPQSPPKRVTRARAAAKTNDAGVKTTTIATAASKAKLTRSASTTKRKTPTADAEDEETVSVAMGKIIEAEPIRATRGRAKKVVAPAETFVESAEPAAPKVTRGRPKKTTVETPAPEPARSLRGRSNKIDVAPEEAPVPEPAKRTIRTRATTITKPPIQKKTVKFEEPDKENVIPATTTTAKGKAKLAENTTGLCAKPVRRPAAITTTRATRGRAKPIVEEKTEKSSPLSPKKITQVSSFADQLSEDELATTEKTPMKPLMKSPVKPPGSIFNDAKKLDFLAAIGVHRVATQDLGASAMASPARRPPQSPFKAAMKPTTQNLGTSAMASPARRVPSSAIFNNSLKPASPEKPTIRTSAPIRISPFKLSQPTSSVTTSDFKASFLQSPARRPQQPPFKITEDGSPSRSSSSKKLFSATPKASTLKTTKFATPRNISKSDAKPVDDLPAPSMVEDEEIPNPQADEPAESVSPLHSLSIKNIEFSGRLSSIVPRAADPDAGASAEIFASMTESVEENAIVVPELMTLDELEAAVEKDIMIEEDAVVTSSTPPDTPSRFSTGTFTLPKGDDNPFGDSDSESEDELASDSFKYAAGSFLGFRSLSQDLDSSPSTPKQFVPIAKTPATTKSISLPFGDQSAKLGFTPLATQLSNWTAISPVKSDNLATDPKNVSAYADIQPSMERSPLKSTYFEDEMSVRDELEAASVPEPETMEDDILGENFTPVELDDEDLDLANEADEMSLLEPEEIEALTADDHDEENEDETPELAPFEAPMNAYEPELELEHQYNAAELAPSEASQEYGDENVMPIDPALLTIPVPQVVSAPTPSTPKRVLTERVCHTVSKVPLKPAAGDTTMRPSPKKRSASISRLPVQRPSGNLKRSSTVISYSPTKSTPKACWQGPEDVTMEDACATPTKSDAALWPALGTPPRTPRRDVDNVLLKGAVVYVDVYTTEGADASVLFNELLVQMGARCVRAWSWSGEDGSKVGITHVVFKDGGKRTLEKVREAGGVVSCVGVGWVLDCERENKWLDETPYAIDTAVVPRGGHRRRKSMEPKALAKLTGTLVATTPARNSHMSPTKEFLNSGTPYTSKSRRRESVEWVRSPSTANEDELADQTLMLSPVPATPKLEAYGEAGLYYGDDTPTGQTPYFLHQEHLIQQTAPPAKGRFFDENATPQQPGHGFLSQKKDESVMMRLMAARRKSLQWAPKVGSPLAKAQAW